MDKKLTPQDFFELVELLRSLEPDRFNEALRSVLSERAADRGELPPDWSTGFPVEVVDGDTTYRVEQG